MISLRVFRRSSTIADKNEEPTEGTRRQFTSRFFMNPLALFALILLSVCSCNKTTSPTDGKGLLITSFTVADTLGHTVSKFRSGEDFDLSLSVTNSTGDTATYHTGYPIIRFEILYGDSVVAASYYGCFFPQVVIAGHLAPGRALQAKWRAPISLCQTQAVPLAPGSYQARVTFPHFDQATVIPVTSLTISIIQ